MAQKLAPAEKNSTDISAESATFCISGHDYDDEEDVLATDQVLCVSIQPSDDMDCLLWVFHLKKNIIGDDDNGLSLFYPICLFQM